MSADLEPLRVLARQWADRVNEHLAHDPDDEVDQRLNHLMAGAIACCANELMHAIEQAQGGRHE